MQSGMVASLLRRAREASGIASSDTHRRSSASSGGGCESLIDMVNTAAMTFTAAMRQVSGELSVNGGDHRALLYSSRKRSRNNRPSSSYGGDAYDGYPLDLVQGSNEAPVAPSATTPPPAKRRGRPPRDYGDELAPAFAMYASENYEAVEQALLERSGSGAVSSGAASSDVRVLKENVLRDVWDNWWLSAQALKDKYLAQSRQEMATNETHMLELLVDYPLPESAPTSQTGLRQSAPSSATDMRPHYSHDPDQQYRDEAMGGYHAYLREQIPLLRSKFIDWSDAEIQRRLTINWHNMSISEQEKYCNSHPGGNLVFRSYTANAAGQRSASRSRAQIAPRRAYVIFCKQERSALVKNNPNWDLPTVNKELGRRWKELPSDQKDIFYAMERKEMEMRSRVNDAGGNGLLGIAGNGTPSPGSPITTPFQRTNGNNPLLGHSTTPTAYGGTKHLATNMQHHGSGRTASSSGGGGTSSKGPSRAYIYYSRIARKEVTDAHPEWDLATVNRELGRLWKSLTVSEKKLWEERVAADAANGTSGSVASTPRRRVSPPSALIDTTTARQTVQQIASVPPLTATPSPLNSTAPVSGGEITNDGSIPATPVSGSTTSINKEGTAAAVVGGGAGRLVKDQYHHQHRNYDDEGESEAEDVSMQDDNETESDRAGFGAYANYRHPSATTGNSPTSAQTLKPPPPFAKPATTVIPEEDSRVVDSSTTTPANSRTTF